MSSAHHRLHSFAAALRGLLTSVRSEANFQLELVLAIIATALGTWLHLAAVEWAILVLAMGGVLAAELFNTAIEQLADVQKPRLDPVVKIVKDVAAAAVLVTSLTALIIGIVLFAPRLVHFWYT